MILATVALAGALLYTRDVMIPFVLAIFITTMVSPLVDFLVLRWRLPGWLAILIALLIVLAILTLLSLALIAAVQTIVHTAGEYSKEVADLSQTILAQLKAHRIDVDQSQIGAELEKMLPGVITTAAGTVTTVLSHGLLIVIFVVFLLAGRNPRASRHGDLCRDRSDHSPVHHHQDDHFSRHGAFGRADPVAARFADGRRSSACSHSC